MGGITGLRETVITFRREKKGKRNSNRAGRVGGGIGGHPPRVNMKKRRANASTGKDIMRTPEGRDSPED